MLHVEIEWNWVQIPGNVKYIFLAWRKKKPNITKQKTKQRKEVRHDLLFTWWNIIAAVIMQNMAERDLGMTREWYEAHKDKHSLLNLLPFVHCIADIWISGTMLQIPKRSLSWQQKCKEGIMIQRCTHQSRPPGAFAQNYASGQDFPLKSRCTARGYFIQVRENKILFIVYHFIYVSSTYTATNPYC